MYGLRWLCRRLCDGISVESGEAAAQTVAESGKSGGSVGAFFEGRIKLGGYNGKKGRIYV